jgi:hypothetical protein
VGAASFAPPSAATRMLTASHQRRHGDRRMTVHGGWLDDVDVRVPGQLPLPVVLPREEIDEDDVVDPLHLRRVVTLQPLARYL